jgi:hypothetical protein
VRPWECVDIVPPPERLPSAGAAKPGPANQPGGGARRPSGAPAPGAAPGPGRPSQGGPGPGAKGKKPTALEDDDEKGMSIKVGRCRLTTCVESA